MKDRSKERKEHERIPFDDALRRILNTPPQHKVAKKKAKKHAKKF